MIRYIIKRILMLIPVLLGVTFIVYLILSFTPGDPVDMILGQQATEETRLELREDLGLDKPLMTRYFDYIVNLCKGDMGKSYKNDIDVAEQIFERFPNTLILAFSSMLLTVLIGIPIGIISASLQNSLVDRIFMVLAMIGVSLPVFWMGLVLVLIFSLRFKFLPASGFDTYTFVSAFRSLILPAIVLSLHSMAVVTRMTRSSMLEVIRQDYIDTARSKGIKESVVVIRHMLKNALIPIVTVVGLQFGTLLGGSIVTETVFAWPGLGRLTVDAIREKDTPTVLGCVVFLAVTFSVVNLLIDIIYAYVDPRIKAQYKRK